MHWEQYSLLGVASWQAASDGKSSDMCGYSLSSRDLAESKKLGTLTLCGPTDVPHLKLTVSTSPCVHWGQYSSLGVASWQAPGKNVLTRHMGAVEHCTMGGPSGLRVRCRSAPHCSSKHHE